MIAPRPVSGIGRASSSSDFSLASLEGACLHRKSNGDRNRTRTVSQTASGWMIHPCTDFRCASSDLSRLSRDSSHLDASTSFRDPCPNCTTLGNAEFCSLRCFVALRRYYLRWLTPCRPNHGAECPFGLAETPGCRHPGDEVELLAAVHIPALPLSSARCDSVPFCGIAESSLNFQRFHLAGSSLRNHALRKRC